MNKIKTLITLTVLAMSVTPGWAGLTKFTVLNKKVSFDVPSDWQTVNKDVGIPLKLLGPIYEDQRPVLLFVPVDLKNEKLVLDDKTKAEESYKLSRLAWLQQFNGKSITFLPLKTFTTDGKKIEIHQFGHLYIFNNVNLEEKSYYINCKKETFHIKTLIQVEHIEKWAPTMNKMIESFRCE
ncbi:MAG: hypothetical protein H7336_12860 [Bacteriovorax sp.]|nr:hypothetical protein [Bacteriovorax sp.]